MAVPSGDITSLNGFDSLTSGIDSLNKTLERIETQMLSENKKDSSSYTDGSPKQVGKSIDKSHQTLLKMSSSLDKLSDLAVQLKKDQAVVDLNAKNAVNKGLAEFIKTPDKSNLGKFFGSQADKLKSTMEGLSGVFKKIKLAAPGIGSVLGTVLKVAAGAALLGMFANTDLGKKVIGTAIGFVGAAFNAIKPVIEKVAPLLWDGLKTTLGLVGGFIKQGFEAALPLLSEAFVSGGKMLLSLFDNALVNHPVATPLVTGAAAGLGAGLGVGKFFGPQAGIVAGLAAFTTSYAASLYKKGDAQSKAIAEALSASDFAGDIGYDLSTPEGKARKIAIDKVAAEYNKYKPADYNSYGRVGVATDNIAIPFVNKWLFDNTKALQNPLDTLSKSALVNEVVHSSIEKNAESVLGLLAPVYRSINPQIRAQSLSDKHFLDKLSSYMTDFGLDANQMASLTKAYGFGQEFKNKLAETGFDPLGQFRGGFNSSRAGLSEAEILNRARASLLASGKSQQEVDSLLSSKLYKNMASQVKSGKFKTGSFFLSPEERAAQGIFSSINQEHLNRLNADKSEFDSKVMTAANKVFTGGFADAAWQEFVSLTPKLAESIEKNTKAVEENSSSIDSATSSVNDNNTFSRILGDLFQSISDLGQEVGSGLGLSKGDMSDISSWGADFARIGKSFSGRLAGGLDAAAKYFGVGKDTTTVQNTTSIVTPPTALDLLRGIQ